MKKITLSILAATNLAITPPVAAKAPINKGPTSEEAIEIFDAYPPARPAETFAELYDRAESKLSAADKDYLAKLLDGRAREKVPDIQIDGNTMIIGKGDHVLRVTAVGTGKKLAVDVNGTTLSEKEFADPERRHKAIERIIKKEEHSEKSALHLLWDLGVPSAHAFDWGTWGPVITVGIMLVGGFYLMKRQQRAQQIAAQSANACSDPQPACCAIGTSYAIHSNGCCQQIGGLKAGSATANCPVGNQVRPNTSGSPFGIR